MVFLNGEAISEPGPRGEQIVDDSFLLLFHAGHEDIAFTVPAEWLGAAWGYVLDTANADAAELEPVGPGEAVKLVPRSVVILRRL
jgi:glycogen operon protein